MKFDLTPLRCFLTVGEEGSFSRAAERLNMTQPSVTAQIKSLEKQLDLKLFERSTRSVVLTPSGQMLADQARRTLKELDGFKAMARRIHRSQKDALRLGAAIYTLDFPERGWVLDAFSEAFPKINIVVDVNFQQELKPLLETGDLDAVLMIAFTVSRRAFEAALAGEHGTELLAPDDLPRIVLRRRRVQLGVPEESPLAQYEVIPADALQDVEVAFPLIDHGALFIDPLGAFLTAAGARLVTPPEGHGVGIERYGAKKRIPTVTLGWFPPRPGQMDRMVVRPVQGLELETEFSVLFGNGALSRSAAEFRRFLDRQEWPFA